MKFIVAFILLALVNTSHAEESDDSDYVETVADQLYNLSETDGIEIQGIDRTISEPKRSTTGGLKQQLRILLSGFNHVIIQSPDGKVERVIIIDKKEPGQNRIILETKRVGNQRLVDTSISGDGQTWIDVTMLVDTGAEFVVLPETMIAKLGITSEQLEERSIQTANGLAKAKTGRLHKIKLGNEILQDAEVAFIEDKLLGGNTLLGMSVLGRFRMTIGIEVYIHPYVRLIQIDRRS